MRPSLVVLILYLCANIFGADTTSIIRGKVFDNNTLEPLLAASVIYGKNQGVITNREGYYVIRVFPGNVSLTFQYIGYKSVTRMIHLGSNDTIELNIGLEHALSQIDQIVVSADKTERKISDLTVSVSVIKPEALSQNHITNAQELINKTSGIEILDGQASIRGGSGFSYGAGSRVLALIDGMPVIAADAGNIKWQFLPLENISQIEIIKGASSVLYGSSALNGIINFRTADADKVPHTQFFTEAGFYDSPKQKKWKWWDSPRFFNSASFSHLRKLGNTDIAIGGIILMDKGYRRLNDEKLGRLDLSLKHFNKKLNGLSYGIKLNSGLTLKTDFILWEDAEYGALKQNESTATELHGSFLVIDPYITFKKNEHFQHDLRIRFQSTQNKFPDGSQNNSDALSFFTEYQFRRKLTKFIFLNVGVSENYSRIISAFYGDHTGLNLAGFSQFEIIPVERLKIVAGLRLEQNSLDQIRDKIVPVIRTGINYRIKDYTYLRASFGQGYRYPSIAEKHASTSLGSVKIYPNPEITAESGWNSELGIKQGILKGNMNGFVDLSAFYSQNKGLIEYLFGLYPDPVTGVFDLGFKATNVEQSRVYGFELEGMVNKLMGPCNTTISGGYIFMYPVQFNPITKKNTDVFLKYRRKHSGKISLDTEYKKFELGFSLFVKSKILNIDDVFLDELTRESFLPGFYEYWTNDNKGYFLMDGNLGYNFNKRYILSLNIKNITNKEYMGRPGDVRPPRSFSIRFTGKI